MNKPRIIIVNEDDIVIGSMDRALISSGQSYIYRVSALWVMDSKGNILLAQRSFSKKHDPGKWGPAVSGTNDEGETYHENIIKEAEEELGIVGIGFKRELKMRRHGEHEYFLQWYSAMIDLPESSFSIQEDEVEQIKWFSPHDLKSAYVERPDDFVSGMDTYLEYFVDGDIG